MPNDILNDLFFGKIAPWENRPENIDEFRRLNQRLGQLSNTLEERLDKETQAILDQYISDRSDLESLLQYDSFKTGFRLGVCLSIRNCIKRAPKSTVPGQHRFGF